MIAALLGSFQRKEESFQVLGITGTELKEKSLKRLKEINQSQSKSTHKQ